MQRPPDLLASASGSIADRRYAGTHRWPGKGSCHGCTRSEGCQVDEFRADTQPATPGGHAYEQQLAIMQAWTWLKFCSKKCCASPEQKPN